MMVEQRPEKLQKFGSVTQETLIDDGRATP